jgi:hypothetical protein
VHFKLVQGRGGHAAADGVSSPAAHQSEMHPGQDAALCSSPGFPYNRVDEGGLLRPTHCRWMSLACP